MNTGPNIENIDYCIELMRNAKNLDMSKWQIGMYDYHQNSIKELHEYGMAACFGGYVAISEKFQKDGGKADPFYAAPVFNCLKEHKAIAYWLKIDDKLAHRLCFMWPRNTEFYGCEREEVTPSMVIEKLEMIKAGEL